MVQVIKTEIIGFAQYAKIAEYKNLNSINVHFANKRGRDIDVFTSNILSMDEHTAFFTI